MVGVFEEFCAAAKLQSKRERAKALRETEQITADSTGGFVSAVYAPNAAGPRLIGRGPISFSLHSNPGVRAGTGGSAGLQAREIPPATRPGFSPGAVP